MLSTVSISKTCGPGASASSSGALGFLASTSRTADESSMGFGPSSRLHLVDSGKTGGGSDMRIASISMSSFEPLLWVLLRLRSNSSFSDMNESMGRREGRHAGGDDDEGPDISQDFLEDNKFSCTDHK